LNLLLTSIQHFPFYPIHQLSQSQQVNHPEIELVTSRHLFIKVAVANNSPADQESQQANSLAVEPQRNRSFSIVGIYS